MDKATIENHLKAPAITAEIHELIESMSTELELHQKESLLQDFHSDRNQFLSQLDHIDDTQELTMTLAIKYIETKCRWINLNTQINYRMVITGESCPVDMTRASVNSIFLGHIEDLIPEQQIEQITEFLTNPVKPVDGASA